MTLTFKLDLDSVKVNQHAKYLTEHTQTHTYAEPNALPRLLKSSVIILTP